jgi:hypothetical protein
MKDTKKPSSPITKRAPFQPISRPDQMLTALFEIKDLATRGESAAIVPLVDSLIAVAIANPGRLAASGWAGVREIAEQSYQTGVNRGNICGGCHAIMQILETGGAQ